MCLVVVFVALRLFLFCVFSSWCLVCVIVVVACAVCLLLLGVLRHVCLLCVLSLVLLFVVYMRALCLLLLRGVLGLGLSLRGVDCAVVDHVCWC